MMDIYYKDPYKTLVKSRWYNGKSSEGFFPWPFRLIWKATSGPGVYDMPQMMG